MADVYTTNGLIWNSWSTGTSTSSVTTQISSVTNNVWLHWNTGTGNSVASVSPAVWAHWVQQRQGYTQFPANPVAWPPPETAEQRVAREARQAAATAERDAVYASQAQERLKASARAQKLLVESLSPQQRECLQANGYFYVEVRGKKYRIDRGWAGNVKLVGHDGKIQRRYCIHPREYCPDEDNMLAQKLLLENDEATFLRLANAS